jgi:hypothetical protein
MASGRSSSPTLCMPAYSVPGTGDDRQGFLWFMSSDLFLTPQLLPRHRRQVILLVIRHLALPHDKDDYQPLRA